MKRVISLMMALAMIISLVPALGMTAMAGQIAHHHDEISFFNKLSGDISDLANNDSSYLIGDVTLTDNISISGDVKLCLNGHKLNLDDHNIYICDSGTLTICNCGSREKGIITNGSGNSAIDNSGILYMDNITISGNSSDANGGGLYLGKDSKTTITDCVITGNTAVEDGDGIYYNSGCFIAGTKIAMADGTEKNIEDVCNGDFIKAFDHETGKLVDAVASEFFKGPEKKNAVILNFESGNTLGIVVGHDLFMKETMKYVGVNMDNVANFVGKHFYNAKTGTWDKLVSYSIDNKLHDYYTVYTEYTLNCIANGMLSVDSDVEPFLNIFEYEETLKIDQAQKQRDIEKYGLSIKEELPIEDIYFEKYNHKYCKIVMGKGLKTMEELFGMYDETMEIEKTNQAKKLTKVTPYSEPVMLAKAVLPTCGENGNTTKTLYIGGNTIIDDLFLSETGYTFMTFTLGNDFTGSIGITSGKLPTNSPTDYVVITDVPTSAIGNVHSNMQNYHIAKTTTGYLAIFNGPESANSNNEPEDDPETDIVVDGQTKTLKYGNNTVVVDANTFSTTEIKDNKLYSIDYTNSNAKIFDVIVPNQIVKSLGKDDKGIEFANRYGYMVVDKVDRNNNNSLVLRLKNTTALYTQVLAMNTKHVDAEVEVSYKSNGKSLPGDVKIYVPCDMETARVFYIIDEHTIGEWKCTLENGYCVFDRYLDGTYVVCK